MSGQRVRRTNRELLRTALGTHRFSSLTLLVPTLSLLKATVHSPHPLPSNASPHPFVSALVDFTDSSSASVSIVRLTSSSSVTSLLPEAALIGLFSSGMVSNSNLAVASTTNKLWPIRFQPNGAGTLYVTSSTFPNTATASVAVPAIRIDGPGASISISNSNFTGQVGLIGFPSNSTPVAGLLLSKVTYTSHSTANPPLPALFVPSATTNVTVIDSSFSGKNAFVHIGPSPLGSTSSFINVRINATECKVPDASLILGTDQVILDGVTAVAANSGLFISSRSGANVVIENRASTGTGLVVAFVKEIAQKKRAAQSILFVNSGPIDLQDGPWNSSLHYQTALF